MSADVLGHLSLLFLNNSTVLLDRLTSKFYWKGISMYKVEDTVTLQVISQR